MNQIRRLMPCQSLDPGRGSFMVHALAVKNSKGGHKAVNLGGIPHPVFRAAHHIRHDRKGAIIADAHPEAYDFIVVYDEELLTL